ncbi:MAG: hypothetical protein J6R98_04225 [Bacteroidaceae bacterium]|nr:hypothetical protein [Bacteroidaceae bacterium]
MRIHKKKNGEKGDVSLKRAYNAAVLSSFLRTFAPAYESPCDGELGKNLI